MKQSGKSFTNSETLWKVSYEAWNTQQSALRTPKQYENFITDSETTWNTLKNGFGFRFF